MTKQVAGLFFGFACFTSVSLFSAASKEFNESIMNGLLGFGDYETLDKDLRVFVEIKPTNEEEKKAQADALAWVSKNAQQGDALCLYFDARNAVQQMTYPVAGFDQNKFAPILMEKVMRFLVRVCLDATAYVQLFGSDLFSKIVPVYHYYFKDKVNRVWFAPVWRKDVLTSVYFEEIVQKVEKWFFSLNSKNFLPCVWVSSVRYGAGWQWGVWGYTIDTIDKKTYDNCLSDEKQIVMNMFTPNAARAFFQHCRNCHGWEKFFADTDDCINVLKTWTTYAAKEQDYTSDIADLGQGVGALSLVEDSQGGNPSALPTSLRPLSFVPAGRPITPATQAFSAAQPFPSTFDFPSSSLPLLMSPSDLTEQPKIPSVHLSSEEAAALRIGQLTEPTDMTGSFVINPDDLSKLLPVSNPSNPGFDQVTDSQL